MLRKAEQISHTRNFCWLAVLGLIRALNGALKGEYGNTKGTFEKYMKTKNWYIKFYLRVYNAIQLSNLKLKPNFKYLQFCAPRFENLDLLHESH